MKTQILTLALTSLLPLTSLALCPSYDECRNEFLASIGPQQSRTTNHFIYNLPTKLDRVLPIDLFHMANGHDSLVVFISGTHGVEGPVGSTFQSRLLKAFGSEVLPNKHDYIFIHALNPYGFATGRRVSENNVDLNRNFSTTLELYSEKNSGYNDVASFLNPTTKADPSAFAQIGFITKALFLLAKQGMAPLRQAILLGQYEHPRGLYFGGNGPEHQLGFLTAQLRPLFERYKKILVIDLHTGFGERGKLHLFPSASNQEVKSRIQNIFEGFQIDFGDEKDFYKIKGSVVDWVVTLAPPSAVATPMVFEYGTKDSQTTWGSIQSIRTMILENQAFFNQAKSNEAQEKITKMIWEMYAPTAPDWEQKCWQQTETVLKKVLARF